MSGPTIDQTMELLELLMMIMGIAITWAVYYGSDRAELPGESRIPEPSVPDDMAIDTRGRSLE